MYVCNACVWGEREATRCSSLAKINCCTPSHIYHCGSFGQVRLCSAGGTAPLSGGDSGANERISARATRETFPVTNGNQGRDLPRPPSVLTEVALAKR